MCISHPKKIAPTRNWPIPGVDQDLEMPTLRPLGSWEVGWCHRDETQRNLAKWRGEAPGKIVKIVSTWSAVFPCCQVLICWVQSLNPLAIFHVKLDHRCWDGTDLSKFTPNGCYIVANSNRMCGLEIMGSWVCLSEIMGSWFLECSAKPQEVCWPFLLVVINLIYSSRY